jgi:hypothetical protein
VPDVERTYTEKEAAHELGLHLQKLKRLRWAGDVRFQRVGNGRGRIRYREADIASLRQRRA